MKGLAIKTIGELIIVVIVIIILGAASVSVLPYIQNLLAQYFGLTVDTQITEAVQCAYVRCAIGCGDASIQNGRVAGSGSPWSKLLPSQTCPCSTDFQDLNGKICDTSSAQYPVEIAGSYQSPTLSRSSFSNPVLDCIYPDTSLPNFIAWTPPFSQTIFRLLIVSTDLVKANPGVPDTCSSPLPDGGIKTFTVSTLSAAWQRIFVFANSPQYSGIQLLPPAIKQTYVTYAFGSPSYTILYPGNLYYAGLTMDEPATSLSDKTIPNKYQVRLQQGNQRDDTKDRQFVAWLVLGEGGLGCDTLQIKPLTIPPTDDSQSQSITIATSWPCSGLNPGASQSINFGSDTFAITYDGSSHPWNFHVKYSSSSASTFPQTEFTNENYNSQSTWYVSGKLVDSNNGNLGPAVTNAQVSGTFFYQATCYTNNNPYNCQKGVNIAGGPTATDGSFQIDTKISTGTTFPCSVIFTYSGDLYHQGSTDYHLFQPSCTAPIPALSMSVSSGIEPADGTSATTLTVSTPDQTVQQVTISTNLGKFTENSGTTYTCTTIGGSCQAYLASSTQGEATIDAKATGYSDGTSNVQFLPKS